MTRVSPIPLARAAHLTLYVDLLRDIGATFDREAARCSLPLRLPENGDYYIPLFPAIQFLDTVAHREGLETLGLLAAERVQIGNFSAPFRRALGSQPTLYGILQAFCAVANHENTALRFWIEEDNATLRVCSSIGVREALPGIEYSEWLANMAVVQVIRTLAGTLWTPTEIAFQATRVPREAVARVLPGTSVLSGQAHAFVRLPRSLLADVADASRLNWPSVCQGPSPRGDEWQPPTDFVGSLRVAIRGYLRDQYPDVQLAARLADTSVRTLQRQLAGVGLTYARLVQQVRIEAATELLGDPEVRMLEVASLVGYDDPSHFSRAFRRSMGLSPREVRRHRVVSGRSPAVG